MISVSEAKEIIRSNIEAVQPRTIPLLQAAGKMLARDAQAGFDIPAFPQSSMDGYAFCFSDWKQKETLLIEGESAAGNTEITTLSAGRAVRIFTGAPVPAGADTVIMQEKTAVENNRLTINEPLLPQGMHVRPAGSEVKAGTLALPANTYLSPAAIGFLSGIGIAEVSVYSPRITILITGKELQQPGNALQYGQVYESNSVTLLSCLQRLSITDVQTRYVNDELNELTAALADALTQSDLILLTGGVSAGDYDFVVEAAAACQVVKLLHKVKQRPGKPLFFGTRNAIPVFGLPGNPSSVLTCFYEYVLPSLEKMMHRSQSMRVINCPLTKTYQKPAGLTHFLKGYYDGTTVTPLDAQESYRMKSFALANCLIKIEEQTTTCAEGEMVEVHLLPQ
ncbi:MAG: molybdopterin molybdotransferase MoeA [Agriterribacter sp.]